MEKNPIQPTAEVARIFGVDFPAFCDPENEALKNQSREYVLPQWMDI